MPHAEISVLTMTWSPSITGDTARPPCVVTAPYSSTSDRSQSCLPSGAKPRRWALPPKVKTLPVAGSTDGEAQATRCAGMSVR